MPDHSDEIGASPDKAAELVLYSRVGRQAVVVSAILLFLALASALVHGSYLGLIGAAVVAPAAFALRFVPLVSLKGDRLEVRKAAGLPKKVYAVHTLRGVGPLARRVLHVQTDAGPLALPVPELSLPDCLLLAAVLQERVSPPSNSGGPAAL